MKLGSGKAMVRWLVLLGALASLAGGCATTDSGYGVPVDAANQPQASAAPPPLFVSAGEAGAFSSTYMGLVEVTFENRTAVWKQVERVAVDFGSPAKNQSVTIVSGEDIGVWARAMVDVVGLGAIDRLGLGGDSRAAMPAGAAAVADAAGGSAAAGPKAGAVPTRPSYPDQHLLTTPFRIAPGLFTKRWILLSTSDNPPGGCVDSMILSYETSDHAKARVLLPFKSYGSAWQAVACPAPQFTPYGH